MKLWNKMIKVIKLISENGFTAIVSMYLQREKEKKILLAEVQKFHLVSKKEWKRQKNTFLPEEPKISIITPLYNTPERYLKELIASVKMQSYTNWELCFSDGSEAGFDYVEKICSKASDQDARIVYKKLDKNEGIVGNTNRCLELASGDFIGLLDHDDLLHPCALFEIVAELLNGAEFVYTDEMKFIRKVKKSVDFVCKSGFGIDELRSHNYICHLVVFKKSLLSNIVPFYRSEYEGSQDYDMVLRLTELTDKIVHIPKILYYWRVHDGSVSKDLSVKSYAVDAAKKAIADQLERQGQSGVVECSTPYETIYRLSYSILNNPLVSIIIWNDEEKDGKPGKIDNLLSLTNYKNIEILTCKSNITKAESAYVILPEINNDRFAWMNNASRTAKGKYLVFLNASCVPINQSWIQEMLMYAQRKDVCAVGAHILCNDEKTYYGGAVIDNDSQCKFHVLNYKKKKDEAGYEANLKHVKNTTGITALCMMVSQDKYWELDGFDETLKYLSDMDFSLKGIEKRYVNVWTCFAQICYTGNKGIFEFLRRDKVFEEKWKEQLELGDKFYHPFLKERKLI